MELFKINILQYNDNYFIRILFFNNNCIICNRAHINQFRHTFKLFSLPVGNINFIL